jgi:hypothetical protein
MSSLSSLDVHGSQGRSEGRRISISYLKKVTCISCNPRSLPKARVDQSAHPATTLAMSGHYIGLSVALVQSILSSLERNTPGILLAVAYVIVATPRHRRIIRTKSVHHIRIAVLRNTIVEVIRIFLPDTVSGVVGLSPSCQGEVAESYRKVGDESSWTARWNLPNHTYQHRAT